MNWIQENKFVSMLAGITLAGAVILFVVGSRGAAGYNAAKADFDSAAADVANFERLPLYPLDENRNGKSKALAEYRAEVEELQQTFDAYRPESLENISSQEFTARLVTTKDEVEAALKAANIGIPENFFLGFEAYATAPARESATGILNYQLSIVKDLMASLASSSSSALLNFHRPRLPEEAGTAFTPSADAVARKLPLEITFKGTEEAARKFVSDIMSAESRYLVIRSLRITNERNEPPRTSDSQMVAPAASAESSSAAASDPFAGVGFVFPDDDPPAEGEAAGEPAEAAPAPAAPAAPLDSGRSLGQVLGSEEIVVFLRIDLLQFLPAKELVQVQN